MSIDRQKLKIAIKTCAQDIKKLKIEMRSQSTCSWKQWNNLKTLKWEATRLCSIAAHSHGKIHRKGYTLEQQAEEVGTASLPFAVAA